MRVSFDSYCSRMWLDHCDENKAPLCIVYTKEEYIERYYEWLLDKWQNRNYREDVNINSK